MTRIIARLSITIALLVICACWIAFSFALPPIRTNAQIESQLQHSKSLATAISAVASSANSHQLETLLRQSVERNPELHRARLVDAQGNVLATIGSPAEFERAFGHGENAANAVSLDIFADGRPWASLQLVYASGRSVSAATWPYPLGVIVLVGVLVGACCPILLALTLRHWKSPDEVSNGVKSALDTVNEGLIMMDRDERIVIANESFGAIVGCNASELVGCHPSAFDWCDESDDARPGQWPWSPCLVERRKNSGVLALNNSQSDRKFVVNAAPIIDENGDCKGVLASFDDVTDLDNKRTELTKMIDILRTSRDEIRRQNEHLQFLASRDPLTRCLNRRSFFEQFQRIWNMEEVKSLAAIMVDIDHFKSINDNYGHSMGDDTIRHTSEVLFQCVRDRGIVCRFGGEEFCIILPNMQFEAACQLAEKVRVSVESSIPQGGVAVTLSVGVSAREFGAMDPQHLLDQADQCLYAAKEQGRNQVVRWDHVTKTSLHQAPEHANEKRPTQRYCSPVAALYSALYFRDRETADHSARVANLSVAIAGQLVPPTRLKLIETAALLHEIGSLAESHANIQRSPIGSQDSWQQARRQDRLSAQFIEASLLSPELSLIVRDYHLPFNQRSNKQTDQMPELAICQSIVAVCDALDTIMNRGPDELATPLHEACESLKQSSGQYFDPEVVDVVITCVTENPDHLKPIQVRGVHFDQDQVDQNVSRKIAAALASGDLAELAAVTEHLDPKHSEERQVMLGLVDHLQAAIMQDDDNLEPIARLTRELFDLVHGDRIPLELNVQPAPSSTQPLQSD